MPAFHSSRSCLISGLYLDWCNFFEIVLRGGLILIFTLNFETLSIRRNDVWDQFDIACVSFKFFTDLVWFWLYRDWCNFFEIALWQNRIFLLLRTQISIFPSKKSDFFLLRTQSQNRIFSSRISTFHSKKSDFSSFLL